MLTTGFDGGRITTSASWIASSTPGRRLGGVGADEHEPLGGDRGAQPYPPLLEVDRPPALVIGDDHVGLDPVVRHGQQPHAGPPPRAQRLRHLGERVAGGEHLRAHDVRGEVPVAQPEPLRLDPVGRELLLDREALIGPPPALLLVDAAAERVHDGVEVGADAEAEQGDVVARVHDRR